jgi:hypothetical protein
MYLVPSCEYYLPGTIVVKSHQMGVGLTKLVLPSTIVLTVNFCQPSHEFTFNVDIDLLF